MSKEELDFDRKNLEDQNVYDQIKKDPKDPRNYLGLILKNELKVMLVSDSKIKTAASCIRINFGSTSDPEEIPGLSHLLEHILFGGNRKHSYINEFEEFVEKNSGNLNAITNSLDTTFQFEVDSNMLEEALEKFVKFFINPLYFDQLGLEKELMNIHSESEMRLINKHPERFNLIDQETCDQTNPFHKYICGNIKSLNDDPKLKGIDIRKALVEHFDKYYSSNQMTLCVLGKQDLNELCDMICNRIPFIKIKNTNVDNLSYDPGSRLFKDEHLKKEIKIASNDDYNEMIIDFKILEYPIFHLYFEKLINCWNREGFDYFLKIKGWITECFTNQSKIHLRLTEQGLERIDQIISYMFQHIKLARSKGVQKHVFKEINYGMWIETVLNLSRKLSSFIETPIDCVKRITSNMFIMKMKDAAYISYNRTSYTTVSRQQIKLTKRLLKYLNPDNLRIVIKSKKFIGQTNRTTKYCLTDYSYEDISEEKIRKWKEIQLHLGFRLPRPKRLIYRNMLKLVEIEQEFLKSNEPILLRNDEYANVWYLQENQINTFQSYYGIFIKNPILSRNSIANACMSIYSLIIFDLIKLDNQSPCLDFELNIEFVDYGLNIVIYGFINNKLKLIIDQIIDLFLQPSIQINREHFEWAKRRFQGSFKEFEKLTLEGLMETKFESFYEDEPFEFEKEVELYFDELTFEKMNEIKKKFFSSIKFLIFGYGNITRDDILLMEAKVVDKLVKSFRSEKMKKEDQLWYRSKMPILEDGSFYILQESTPIHRVNFIFNYYQFGFIDSIDDLVKLHLLRDLIDHKFYNQVNKERDLGYFLSIKPQRIGDTIGLSIQIESLFEIDYLDYCIEEFLIDSFNDYSKVFCEERLIYSKKRLKLYYKTMYEFVDSKTKFNQLWTWLSTLDGEDNVDINLKDPFNVIKQTLKTIELKDLIDLFDNKLKKNKRKLSIRILGVNKANRFSFNNDVNKKQLIELKKSELKQKLKNNGVLLEGKPINDLNEFRKSHTSYKPGCAIWKI